MSKNYKKQAINIGIFGFGNMGQAISRVLGHSQEFKSTVFIYDRNKLKDTKTELDLESLFVKCDYVFLAIKPQDFQKLKPLGAIKSPAIVISLMAGIKISNIKKVFSNCRIVRAMPNLPVQIGQGVTGWYLDEKQFSANELKPLNAIFSQLGLSVKLQNEKMIDAITAISGSGPAYVFLFIDSLIKAALNLGFKQAEAEKIVMQTLVGSLEYINRIDKPDLGDLIKRVQSKGGTTEAALRSLDTKLFYKQWQQATNQAYRKSQQISQK